MDSQATGDFYSDAQAAKEKLLKKAAKEELLRSLETIERHYGLNSQLLERVRNAFVEEYPLWIIPLAEFLKEAAHKVEES
jgi:hypothetical protein